jgi:ribonuclease HI
LVILRICCKGKGNNGCKKAKGVEKFRVRMLQHNALTMKDIKTAMLHKWKKRGWKSKDRQMM